MNKIKRSLERALAPEILCAVRSAYHRYWIVPKIQKTYSPMSMAEVFCDIYASKRWGEPGPERFNSGAGSSVKYSSRYCEAISRFVSEQNIEHVVDLGCGDFRVGRVIASLVPSYIGVDIVPELIEHNNRTFGTDHIRFLCVDITCGALPPANLCLIRQVFQHLSNDEILRSLQLCRQYAYLVVSEHVPAERPTRVNVDKPHGPDTRLYQNSGIFLDAPPFSEKPEVLLESAVDSKSVIRTVLIRNPKA